MPGVEDGVPGLVLWLNPETGEIQMHRLLDLEIDTPMESPNSGSDGGKWHLPRLHGEPDPEDEVPESRRGLGWPPGEQDGCRL